MQCWKCDKEVPDTSRFCPYCGADQQDAANQAAAAASVAAAAAVPDISQSAVPEPAAPPPAMPVEPPVVPPVPTEAVAAQPPAPQPVVEPQSVAQPVVLQPQVPPVPQPGIDQQPPVPPAAYPAGVSAVPETAQEAPKKRSALPFIIGGIAVLLVAAIVVVALVLPGLVKPKQQTALEAMSKGTENLLFNTSSATVTAEMGTSLTAKWELGKDLASSTIWGYVGDYGVVLRNNTLIVYQASSASSSASGGSGIQVVAKQSGVIDYANVAINEEYNIGIDLNKIVNNGKLDRAYIEQMSQKLSDAAGSDLSSNPMYGLGVDSENADKLAKIISDFMTVEVNKQDVQDKFMSNASTKVNGSATDYQGTINPQAMIQALGDYAKSVGDKDSSYADAADQLRSYCVQATSSLQQSTLGNIDIGFTVDADILTKLKMSFTSEGVPIVCNVQITGINSTHLDGDSKLQQIMDAPESPYGGNLFSSNQDSLSAYAKAS
ncbi:MAG: zinc ribbon domain-containing protein [Actinomycetia bacterium]|nr:zinc ribbon domain-containing protein [Actinomycetes bacterium]